MKHFLTKFNNSTPLLTKNTLAFYCTVNLVMSYISFVFIAFKISNWNEETISYAKSCHQVSTTVIGDRNTNKKEQTVEIEINNYDWRKYLYNKSKPVSRILNKRNCNQQEALKNTKSLRMKRSEPPLKTRDWKTSVTKSRVKTSRVQTACKSYARGSPWPISKWGALIGGGLLQILINYGNCKSFLPFFYRLYFAYDVQKKQAYTFNKSCSTPFPLGHNNSSFFGGSSFWSPGPRKRPYTWLHHPVTSTALRSWWKQRWIPWKDWEVGARFVAWTILDAYTSHY